MIKILKRCPGKKIPLPVLGVIIWAGIMLFSGCSAKDKGGVPGNTSVNTTEGSSPASTVLPGDNGKQEKDRILAEFKGLMDKESEPSEIIAFLDREIAKAGKENASFMIISLENTQKDYLFKLEETYIKDHIQPLLNETLKLRTNIDSLEDISNEEVKNLLKETMDSGFKVETAEGMYFPIIDYGVYKKYGSFLEEDIKDYINIMAVESDKVPAKDAALVIGWDEVIKRAVAQESFLKSHEGSEMAGQVRELYKKYTVFTFYGLNNTPLFSYETKEMVQNAKEAYSNAIKNGGKSQFINSLNEYMSILENNEYKLSEKAKDFRREITK